jgi:hypothetical protein
MPQLGAHTLQTAQDPWWDPHGPRAGTGHARWPGPEAGNPGALNAKTIARIKMKRAFNTPMLGG